LVQKIACGWVIPSLNKLIVLIISVLPRLGLQVDENSVIGLVEYMALQQMQPVYL